MDDGNGGFMQHSLERKKLYTKDSILIQKIYRTVPNFWSFKRADENPTPWASTIT